MRDLRITKKNLLSDHFFHFWSFLELKDSPLTFDHRENRATQVGLDQKMPFQMIRMLFVHASQPLLGYFVLNRISI